MGGNRELERAAGLRVMERGEEGVKIEELSLLLTPKIQRPRPGLMTGIRAGRVFSPSIYENGSSSH